MPKPTNTTRLLPWILTSTTLLTARPAAASNVVDLHDDIRIVQTVPTETVLRPAAREPAQEWAAGIAGAKETIDWAAFYVSGEPGSRLEPVVAALIDAAHRGVWIRFLADAGFYKTYPDILDDLAAVDHIQVRLVDYKALAGGVMHAKYFILDRREAYVGSQNTDWRSLEHIWETGAWIELPDYVRALGRIFLMDWADGAHLGEDSGSPVPGDPGGVREPPEGRGFHENDYGEAPPIGPIGWWTTGVDGKPDSVYVYPAFSPRDRLENATQWDLPLILNALRAAEDSVHVTCLTYSPQARDGTYWEVLDDELRKAAVRGVQVRLMVSDWSKRKPTIDYLKSLACVPGLEVRMVTIPEASSGFIPFARVIHSKFMTVDGTTFWLGTGNWEKSYFTTTRNVGLIGRHPRVTRELDASFRDMWNSPYAYPVDPGAEYEPPRVGP